MTRMAAAACLAAYTGLGAFAQTPSPAFDVASVRSAAPEQQHESKARPHRIHTTPGNVVMRNVGLTETIEWAYNVEAYQIVGPNWMEATRFDIVAKAPGPATEDDMRVMMQTLLANRFSLTVHRENKEMAGMVLLVGKGGPKLKASEDQGESVFQPVEKKMAINMRHMSMHEFASLLSEPMRKPVIDLTDLKGTFDFMIDATNYAPPDPAPGQPREQVDDSYLVVRALQDQLGLRLEPRKLNIDMLVVDHLEKVPTEN